MLLSLSMLAAAVITGPAPNPAKELIILARQIDGNKDLFLVSLDGQVLKRLTSDPADDESPRCSPDGKAVLFLRGGFGKQGEIHHLDLVTGTERRLTNNDYRDMTPQWSPKGDLVYFTTRPGGHDRIAVMRPTGEALRYLTPSMGWDDTMPGVSPDGRKLVHHTYRYGKDNSELHLLDLNKTTARRLTSVAGFDYEASYAGRETILFSSNRGSKYFRLHALSLKDGTTRLLADTGFDAWGPRFSPRSRQVLFTTGADNAWRLRRMPIGGGAVSNILPGDPPVFGADWCPSSR